MDVRILKLRMQEFKGIHSLEISMDGANVAIFGQNATGKTTVFDAFTWCLFGKDSSDRSDFWVKPHDVSGDEIHHLETEVEVQLSIDGKPQTFRHMVAENWVKKNGEHEQVYSGNNHKYWVNDVTMSAGDYTKAVSAIVSPEVFRLITNPMAFNAIKWDKRREFLLKLSPVDVDQIMLERAEYAPIRDAMAAHDTDIYGVKKVQQDKRRRDNEELAQIPIRISEQVSIRDSLGDCDVAAAKAEIASIDAKIAELDDKLRVGGDGASVIKEKADLLRQATATLQEEELRMNRAKMEAETKVSREQAAVAVHLNSSRVTLEDIERRVTEAKERVARLEAKNDELKKQWYEIDAEKAPEFQPTETCPFCGQPMPEAKIEEARAKHEELFEKKKDERLDEITEQGKRNAGEIESLKETIDRDMVRITEIRAGIEEDEAKLTGLKAEKAALEADSDYKDTEKIAHLRTVVAERQEAYDKAVSNQTPVDDSIRQKKAELTCRKNELLLVEAKQKQLEVCQTRIDALEQRHSELGAQVADTERFLILIDKFVTERCGLLEESINSLFPTVRWSLFEQQINGGIKDACVCLINGVQFSDANNAARINAGLEIISVLSKHYGVTVPVFVDNAEAVNELQAMDAQRVALVVTSGDKALRIEKEV